MSSRNDPTISTLQLAGALAIGSIAILVVGLQPILLGALVEAGQVSLEGVGLVAMAEIIMLGVGVVVGDTMLPVARLRRITILAGLCTAGLDLLTLQAVGDASMTAVRAATGLSEGVLIWGTTGVIVRTAQPARVAGVFFVLQTLAQALLGFALAQVILPRWGWQGEFVALALLAVLVCPLALVQPARLAPLAPPTVSGFRWSTGTLQPLAVAFFQLAALGSFWAYLEPLGQAAGLNAQAAQTLIAAVLAVQVVGGSVAALAVRRLPLLPTLVICSALLAAVTTTVHGLPVGSHMAFSLSCSVFGFVWMFMMPFHIALAFRADSSGRLAGLVPAAQLLGSAFGPLMASFVIEGDNASAVPLLSAAFAVTAAVLVVLGRARSGAPPVRVVS